MPYHINVLPTLKYRTAHDSPHITVLVATVMALHMSVGIDLQVHLELRWLQVLPAMDIVVRIILLGSMAHIQQRLTPQFWEPYALIITVIYAFHHIQSAQCL